MMRRFIKALLCSAALSSAALSDAHASDQPYARHEGWTIEIGTKFNGCSMTKEWNKGTQLYVAYDIANDNFVMRISNENWTTPIRDDWEYAIKFVFDNTSVWTGKFQGMSDGKAILAIGLKVEFIKAFMQRSSVDLYTSDNRHMTGMMLNGSWLAIGHVVQCANVYQNVPRDRPSRPSTRAPGPRGGDA